MAAGEARAHHRRTGRCVRICRVPGVFRRDPLWDGLPYIVQADTPAPYDVLRNGPGHRPYIEAKTPQRWTWRPYKPEPAEVALTIEEHKFGDRARGKVILEPNLKAAAPRNKDWGWERWCALALELSDRGIAYAQVGAGGTRLLPGAHFIETPSIRHAVACLSRARAAVLHEGALHHAAAAVSCPAVVIFGGYISPEVTGYEGQRSLFWKSDEFPLGCGMRQSCRHCAAAMSVFNAGYVYEQLEVLL